MYFEVGSLLLVAFLWGVTNPLIKKGTKHKTTETTSNFKALLSQWKQILTNINFIIPFGLNQLGSVLYFFTLQNTDLSLAVPVTNSMNFVFTAIAGIILGEKKPGSKTYLGILMVLLGTFIICYDRFKMGTRVES